MKRNLTLIASLFLLFSIAASAQQSHPPFWKEIQQFKQEDSIHPPSRHPILFVGSSSFRKWTSVQKDFPGYPIINRGFGGSHLPDLIRYANDIIIPYQPKQIVIYCGDNDAASSNKISADSILLRFEHLYRIIRSKLPKTRVTYIAIKPSPSRQRLFPVMEKANWEIKSFLEKQQRTDFVDVYHPMLDDFGQPRKELFTSDMLHMNADGYVIWQKLIKPYLVK